MFVLPLGIVMIIVHTHEHKAGLALRLRHVTAPLQARCD
jgi:hypothetical protein